MSIHEKINKVDEQIQAALDNFRALDPDAVAAWKTHVDALIAYRAELRISLG